MFIESTWQIAVVSSDRSFKGIYKAVRIISLQTQNQFPSSPLSLSFPPPEKSMQTSPCRQRHMVQPLAQMSTWTNPGLNLLPCYTLAPTHSVGPPWGGNVPCQHVTDAFCECNATMCDWGVMTVLGQQNEKNFMSTSTSGLFSCYIRDM